MNGQRHELEPRVAQVLVALASARPNVLSRDGLIEQCWDGRIVGDDALNRCIVALRQLGKEFSPEPFTIETVPRVGYALVESPAKGLRGALARSKLNRKFGYAALLTLLVAGALAFTWFQVGSANSVPASIAVLPFRNLSAGDPYFAEGIGEEIVGQLAREPEFRVVGRFSSAELGKDASFRDVGQRLNVNYLLKGSVRTQGGQVRVNAGLVRATDGAEIWSESYDGKLDDIFAIQQRIGGAIARALRRKLVRAPALAGPMVTNGEAYNLYLTARGLIKTRNMEVFVTSSNVLREAIKLDPAYAPAWASLAESTSLENFPDGSEGLIAALPRAIGYARHAIQLAPDLADGHRALGSLLPYGSPEALSHLRRAAELDPNSAETLIALASALAAAGEFDNALAAYRGARELDPLWFRTTGQLAIRLAETGRRAEAEAIANSGFAQNPANLHIILGRIAWVFGDLSEAARHWSVTARLNSPRWSPRARMGVTEVKVMVGIDHSAFGYKPGFTVPQRSDVQVATPPEPATWQMHNRNAAAAEVYRDDNQMAAKLMLKAGRAKKLAATYDGPVGLLTLRADAPIRADQLHEAAIVALALREAGRREDADRLLSQAAARIVAVYHQRSIPFALDADVAAIWAVQGRADQALSMLERAMSRGWTDIGNNDMPDIADEPAFSSLRGQPRFKQLRSKLAAHLARERAETLQLRI